MWLQAFFVAGMRGGAGIPCAGRAFFAECFRFRSGTALFFVSLFVPQGKNM